MRPTRRVPVLLRTLSATRAALGRHVPDPVAAAIKSGGQKRTHAGERRLEEPVNHIVTLADAIPPPALANTRSAAATLCEGTVELLNRPALAIVGSRNATAQGIANAESLRGR